MSLVGLDVHASQTHAAVLDMSSGELRGVRLRMAPGQVVEFLATLPGPVRAVYEAGPTGFGLARLATERGIDVRVVAAGKVPRASGDRVKTDKRDAERLARLLAAGELRFAYVPSIADEQFRDVIRAIEDCRGDLMRARHRLSKMLLRREIRWAGPGSAWTQKHMIWLRSLRFEDLCSQAAFIDYLSGVEMLVARRAALIAALEQVIPDSRHAPTIARLRCFRGIDTLSAAGLCAEVGDWRRFRPKQLSGFLGIVPTEHTSDIKRRQGSITKAGSVHARRLLVEAAHHYRHQPAVGTAVARRQEGQDPTVIEIAWRAQRRLHQRWTVLAGQRRKPAGVVAIACARELAAFCWEAATLN
jgi:transposase